MSPETTNFGQYSAKKDALGRSIHDHAQELPFAISQALWEEKNNKINNDIDRNDCQILVVNHKSDFSADFVKSLIHDPLGRYPFAGINEAVFPDGERDVNIVNESHLAKHVYIVTSISDEVDSSRVRRVADHLKNDLKVKFVTLISTHFFGTRQDKNVDKGLNYVPKTINIRAELGALSPFIDRIITFEPHSAATQTFAACFGMPLAPLSPWQYVMDNIVGSQVEINDDTVQINSQTAIEFRPDKGRNIAATRIANHYGFETVSFTKTRVSPTQTVAELNHEDRKRIKGKILVGYEDEFSTLGTLLSIANIAQESGALGLVVGGINAKFTLDWEKVMKHPAIKRLIITDSRNPIGKIGRYLKEGKIEKIPLTPLLRQLIEADLKGINFWKDPTFKKMIIQK